MAGSMAASNTHSYQVILNSFQAAVTNLLSERCQHLTQLLQSTPLKDVQYILGSLVENIFGFRTGSDWGFLSLDKDLQAKDFDHLRCLIHPNGPLLHIVHRLTEESNVKFEFPIRCLPMPTQMMFHEGKVPALYANKLQILNPGVPPSTLQLNAFEFYFFHFTYFMVNPTLKNALGNIVVNQQDTLYAHVLEDYFLYYLPTDNRAIPLSHSNVQHSPILTSALSSPFGNTPERQSVSRDLFSPLKRASSLLKKDAVLMVHSTPTQNSSGAESWTSETFLLILKEMYLNQISPDQKHISSMKSFIPSHYHVWMVRILVKHLHFFFNSSSGHSPSHGQIMIDSLGRLKSLGMTHLLQKEMYSFLKNTFDHWPLDASFRVPLETYLSYIQPWRYVHSDLDTSLWQKFMTENLHFYTTIFQQILKRFVRMDLSCPKNAYMLYRLTKVVCTRDLREMIMQAEKGCLSKSGNSSSNSIFVQRSPEKLFLRRVSQLELSGSTYLPLFSEPVFNTVSQLLVIINGAKEKVSQQTSMHGTICKGWVSSMLSIFETSNDGLNSDDNHPSDIQKAASYLSSSIEQLCLFFPEVPPPNPSMYQSSILTSTQQEAQHSLHDSSSLQERMQVLRRKGPLPASKEITYQGNPDLQPVRTYEVGWMVKVLNDISQHFNEKFELEIRNLYNKNSIMGKVSRRVLAKPLTYHNLLKSKDMQASSWKPVNLPPRINMRVLADKQVIGYLLFLIFVAYLFGYNPIVSLLFLSFMFSVFIVLSALLYPSPNYCR